MYSSEGSDDYPLHQQEIGRREFIEGLILLGGLALASYFLPGCFRITEPLADKSATGRPNILLIFPDQHRGDYLHYMGHPSIITPNLDRLASESVSFTRCSTNSPLCMPARASLLTGQLVSQHGVWSNADIAADRRGSSHVRSIREAAYHTAVIGKTHLYVHSGAIDTRNHVHELNDWGYTDTHELTGPRASANVDSPYTEYLAEEGLLDIHREYMSNYNAAIKNGTLRPWDDPPCPLPTEAHLDSYTGWQAVDWIKNYKGDNIIGFYQLVEHELIIRKDLSPWITCVFIDKQERGQRLSSKLLEHGRAIAGKLGYEKVYLTTDHIKFYEKFGFREIGLDKFVWGRPTKIYEHDTIK